MALRFAITALSDKTYDDICEILSKVDPKYHYQMMNVVFKQPSTRTACTALQLAKMMNVFEDDITFVLNAFERVDLLFIVKNKGFFVVLESIYLKNALTFINYVKNIMGDGFDELFTDIATIRKSLSILDCHKINFVKSIKDRLIYLLLTKVFGLVSLLNIFDKHERPEIINILAGIVQEVIVDYTFHILQTPPRKEVVRKDHIYFFKEAGNRLGYAIMLPSGHAVKSTLDIVVHGKLTATNLSKLRPNILEMLSERKNIASYNKGINATAYGSVLKIIPVEYYNEFINLTKGFIDDVFVDVYDFLKALRIIPKENHVVFLNLNIIQRQINRLYQHAIDLDKINDSKNKNTMIFASNIMASFKDVMDIPRRINKYLSAIIHQYCQLLAIAETAYASAIEAKETVVVIPTLLGLFSDTKKIQEFDIQNKASDSLLVVIELFLREVDSHSNLISIDEIATARNIMEKLNDPKFGTLEECMKALSDDINAHPNNISLLALEQMLKSKIKNFELTTIRFNFNTPTPILAPQRGYDLLDQHRTQFPVDAERCYQVVIEDAGKLIVIIDTLPNIAQYKDSTRHDIKGPQLNHEDIIKKMEESGIPLAFRYLIYQCNQKGYANHMFAEITGLLATMGIIVMKGRTGDYSELGTRIIKFNRLGEFLVVEERFRVGRILIDAADSKCRDVHKAPQDLQPEGYIKVIHKLDASGRYCNEPTVTVSLPAFVFQNIEEKFKHVSTSNEQQQRLLSELRPRLIHEHESRVWSEGNSASHFVTSGPSSSSSSSSSSDSQVAQSSTGHFER